MVQFVVVARLVVLGLALLPLPCVARARHPTAALVKKLQFWAKQLALDRTS